MNNQKEMTYKKLFNIHYNNKTFTIFIDEYDRRTFLEVDNSGNYIYPLIDDFIQLHKIYNERDIFTLYDGPFYAIGEHLPIHKTPKVIFKENVREATSTIACILAFTMFASSVTATITNKKFELVKNDKQITIVIDYADRALIENTEDLDNALGYKTVSLEDIINTINQNNKIDEEYKKYVIEFVTFMKNKYPNTDQRIFYENMKNCAVEIKTAEQIGKGTAGTYNSNTNIVSIREDYTEDAEVIIHEFAHAYHHWKENKIYKPKYRTEQAGHSLDEAMTNKIISGLIPTNTYIREKKVLDYFLSCVDYNYYDYESEGITKLISLLKEKYPEADIDYIINSFDTMKDTYYSIGEKIKLEETPETLEQLFNICICNIDLQSNSVYQPFMDFLKLIDYNSYENIAEEYLKRYNDILLQKGYSQTKVKSDIQDFKYEIDTFRQTKLKFEEICASLTVDNISQDDIYKPLKTFITSPIPYTSEGELKNYFCDILDIYNNFLYRNGYTRDETITREEMKEKIKKFEGIKIVGYTVTNDNVIHPIININSNTSFYGKETKIPTLNEQGRVFLIDKANTVIEETIDGNDFQYCFFRELFNTLDNPSTKFDENFWQHTFNLEAYQYKKFALYLDGNKIAEDYLKDLSVIVSQTKDGDNTFTLTAKDKAIYRENIELYPVVIPMDQYLYSYLKSNQDASSIELREILNKDYLRSLINENDQNSPINYSSAFSSLFNFNYNMENDNTKIHSLYSVILDDNNEKISLDQIKLQLDQNEVNISIGKHFKNVEKYIKGKDETSVTIPFETVLNYYEMLHKDKLDYHFTEQEIIDLYNYYVQDVYVNEEENIITHGK